MDWGGEEEAVGDCVADGTGVIYRKVVHASCFWVEAERKGNGGFYGSAGENLEEEEDDVVDDDEEAVAVDEPVHGAGGGGAGETFDEEDDRELGE